MLSSIADDQNSQSTPAPNQTNGKHRGADPFSDVALGHASTSGKRSENGNNAYSDDPYAERRSDEVDDYEMEQQQVRHSHHKRGTSDTNRLVDHATTTRYSGLSHIQYAHHPGATGRFDRPRSNGAE